MTEIRLRLRSVAVADGILRRASLAAAADALPPPP